MSTTSRYLFPPTLKTVLRAPRKLAVGKSARTSCGESYCRPLTIRYHAFSGPSASGCSSANSRRAFREMIRNAWFPWAGSRSGNQSSQFGNIPLPGQSSVCRGTVYTWWIGTCPWRNGTQPSQRPPAPRSVVSGIKPAKRVPPQGAWFRLLITYGKTTVVVNPRERLIRWASGSREALSRYRDSLLECDETKGGAR